MDYEPHMAVRLFDRVLRTWNMGATREPCLACRAGWDEDEGGRSWTLVHYRTCWFNNYRRLSEQVDHLAWQMDLPISGLRHGKNCAWDGNEATTVLVSVDPWGKVYSEQLCTECADWAEANEASCKEHILGRWVPGMVVA